MDLTILLPCLNEAETLQTCITKAKSFLEKSKINGEIVVADNGSTDGSQDIAAAAGARVITVPVKGYGSALQNGIEASLGTNVIMGDADDSYDFSRLESFVSELDNGSDLVIGNRFKGGIAPGAMPFLHKYLGNPVLSFIGRLFFKIPISDFHCGLRGFRRSKILSLNLTTTGMEYASEMIVRAALSNYKISEVPTTLQEDGRSRKPHLNTWRDGWRHLRFLLLFSPRWLFLYPSLACLAFGVLLSTLLLPGNYEIINGVNLGIHSYIMGIFLIISGVQGVCFSIISRNYAMNRGFIPAKSLLARTTKFFSLEPVLLFTVVLLGIGGSGVAYSIQQWVSVEFGDLQVDWMTRILIASVALIIMAIQVIFTAFLSEFMDIKISNQNKGS